MAAICMYSRQHERKEVLTNRKKYHMINDRVRKSRMYMPLCLSVSVPHSVCVCVRAYISFYCYDFVRFRMRSIYTVYYTDTDTHRAYFRWPRWKKRAHTHTHTQHNRNVSEWAVWMAACTRRMCVSVYVCVSVWFNNKRMLEREGILRNRVVRSADSKMLWMKKWRKKICVACESGVHGTVCWRSEKWNIVSSCLVWHKE